jgi:hypothetical protein
MTAARFQPTGMGLWVRVPRLVRGQWAPSHIQPIGDCTIRIATPAPFADSIWMTGSSRLPGSRSGGGL